MAITASTFYMYKPKITSDVIEVCCSVVNCSSLTKNNFFLRAKRVKFFSDLKQKKFIPLSINFFQFSDTIFTDLLAFSCPYA